MKNRLIICGLVLISIISVYAMQPANAQTKDVLRLHIIANSDDREDQEAKLIVRDAILAAHGETLSSAQDLQQAIEIAKGNVLSIEKTANDTLHKQGVSQRVKVEVGKFDFPAKVYAGERYPAGKYDALRVVIGEGEGRNWWCVLYPALCMVEENNEKAEQTLPKMGERVTFRSAIWDFFTHKEEEDVQQ